MGREAKDYHAVVGSLPCIAPTALRRVAARVNRSRAVSQRDWHTLDTWAARLGAQLCALDLPRLAATRFPASALV